MSIKYSKRFILSEDAIAEILSYNWPGNVRELQNAIERSCILAKDGIINSKMLGVKIKLDNKKIVSSFLYDEIIESFDKEVAKIIIKALKKTEGKIYGKDGAAALLKLKPTTLQSKIKKLGIDKKYLSEI
jgi:DNA-binding NtrC family response regulator